jgi:hypothetical protein
MALAACCAFSLPAQTYASVPVDSAVYRILENAEMRGLCAPLNGVKPYSRAVVLAAITAILNADIRFGALTEAERGILEDAQIRYGDTPQGLDWSRGAYHVEGAVSGARTSMDVGVMTDLTLSGALSLPGKTVSWGGEFWIGGYINGDIGSHFSYGFTFSGAFLRSQRAVLGYYNTYSKDFGTTAGEGSYQNEVITVYSQPLSYFPYAYQKRWDGFVFPLNDLSSSGQAAWPEGLSVGYNTLPELGGAFLDNHLSYRVGRLYREWGAMTAGGSLIMNQRARPFLALEASVSPFDWFHFSTLTGVLEYYNQDGLKKSAETNQNAFSVSMMELNLKNYLHFDVGSTVIWPKRFELGYLFPLIDNFLYQNNVGDFDNMAIFFNLKGQFPGIAKAWFSFFLDEVNIADRSKIFELDREMYAFQAGTAVVFPWLPFASLSLRYTKIEPYCYTHTKEFVPWYGGENGSAMETAYVNNGESLGYYLPPNSDELLVRFETLPWADTPLHVQYQMIRHGADFGPGAVDGSSLRSELDPRDRSGNPILMKYFLRDGAYQWLHIVKAGGELSLGTAPLHLFAEAGVVFSHFTNIEGAPNSGSPSSYSKVDNADYPATTTFIATLGVSLFLR